MAQVQVYVEPNQLWQVADAIGNLAGVSDLKSREKAELGDDFRVSGSTGIVSFQMEGTEEQIRASLNSVMKVEFTYIVGPSTQSAESGGALGHEIDTKNRP